jgi:hypothetical protein
MRQRKLSVCRAAIAAWSRKRSHHICHATWFCVQAASLRPAVKGHRNQSLCFRAGAGVRANWLIAIRLAASPPSPQFDVCDFDLKMFQAILAGFLVAMLGILIPASITEKRHKFKQEKECRQVCSKARTGVDYLALQLCTADFVQTHAIIHKVHYYKHQAVVYPQFDAMIRDRYDSKITGDDWDNAIYWKLWETRKLLKAKASQWDSWSPAERLKHLELILPDVNDVKEPSHLLAYLMVRMEEYEKSKK